MEGGRGRGGGGGVQMRLEGRCSKRYRSWQVGPAGVGEGGAVSEKMGRTRGGGERGQRGARGTGQEGGAGGWRAVWVQPAWVKAVL